VSVNGTLIEDKMRRFKGKYAHFSFNKCPIYTHGSASAKFSTNSHETDNSVASYCSRGGGYGAKSYHSKKRGIFSLSYFMLYSN
jgi:hypothetical protein